MIAKGSCLCKGVAYEVELPFERFMYCHCSRCRKATGSGHAANAYVQPAAFRWLRGEAQIVRFDLPEARSFSTSFCSTCGAPIPHATRSGREVIVPAGSFDVDPGDRPTENSCWTSRAAWSTSTADLPVGTPAAGAVDPQPERWRP